MITYPPDSAICEQFRRGQLVFADGSNPCADPGSAFALLFLIAVVGAILYATWALRVGGRKGYGLIASLSASPFLLNELPARPGSEEDLMTRRAARKTRVKRSGAKNKPKAKPKAGVRTVTRAKPKTAAKKTAGAKATRASSTGR